MWITVATSLPYGHSAGLRRMVGETTEFTEQEAASFEALCHDYETLEAEHARADDLREAIDQCLCEIETVPMSGHAVALSWGDAACVR
jgi:ParB family chromosome partitioning protein